MKTLCTIFLLFTTTVIRAQSIFNFKNDMVWVESAKLFVCKYEVTNGEYKIFTHGLLKDSVQFSKDLIYANYYPDTASWTAVGGTNANYYYTHPAFHGYPVAGVSYEGAVKYCEWLTKKYGEGKYKFRLPTKNEFLMYAQVGESKFAGGIEAAKDGKGKYLFNYKSDTNQLKDSLNSNVAGQVDGYVYTNAARCNKKNVDLNMFDENGKLKSNLHLMFKENESSFPADKNGLFNLNGNVSELVSEKESVMGSNWNCDLKDCNYNVKEKQKIFIKY